MNDGKNPEIPNPSGENLNNNLSNQMSPKKHRGLSPALKRAMEKAQRSLRIIVSKPHDAANQEVTQNPQRMDIGKRIAKDKDVSHYTRRILWQGVESAFRDKGKETPA